MPFMVIYRTSDGTSNHEQVEAIDEAALFVERLRNNDGVDQIRIYRMEEISFAFRPYYKVELGMPERQQHPSPPVEVVGGVAPALAVPAEPVVTATVEEPADPDTTATEVPDATGGLDEPEELEAVAEAPVADLPHRSPSPSSPAAEMGTNGARRGLFGR